MNTVWLVEMWNPDRDRWEPTVGTALTKTDAEVVRRGWAKANPSDRFRVWKYVAI